MPHVGYIYKICITNKWKEFSVMTQLWSKLYQGSFCTVLKEIRLLDCFLAAAFKKKYNEIIAECQTNTHTHCQTKQACRMPDVDTQTSTQSYTHTFTDRVQKPHIHTQKPLLSINHIHAHMMLTAAVHTSPPLVQTQTPHASAPRSMSHRPQE